MLNFEEIKKYWNDRASGDSTAQSTTQDVYLREIEVRVLSEALSGIDAKSIADFGCGDGRTTARLAQKLSDVSFVGYDYADAMVKNASTLHSAYKNLAFAQADVTSPPARRFDAVYTTRCLINLPSWAMQKQAIRNLADALHDGGYYLMIENFIEGQNNFNEVRRANGLAPIAVRSHNHFFVESQLMDFVSEYFSVESSINISSTYYLVSRIVYSKICAQTGQIPDYFDDHHRLAADLPFSGEFGPVRFIKFRKRTHA